MKHYDSIYTLPFENYFRIVNTGNYAYLYEFKQNNPDSKLDINAPPETVPDEFKTTWENLIYQFENIDYSESFQDSIQLTLNLIQLALSKEEKNSRLKLNTERIIDRLNTANNDNGQINISKTAMNLEAIFEFKKDIFSKRFTMSIAEFRTLEDMAKEKIEYMKSKNK